MSEYKIYLHHTFVVHSYRSWFEKTENGKFYISENWTLPLNRLGLEKFPLKEICESFFVLGIRNCSFWQRNWNWQLQKSSGYFEYFTWRRVIAHFHKRWQHVSSPTELLILHWGLEIAHSGTFKIAKIFTQ